MMTPKTQRIFVVPFSHLDLFWLGNRHECWSRGARIFREAIRLCEKDRAFRFLIEDAVFLDSFVRTVPDQRAALKRLMKAGRIEAPAKWAAITVTNVNGETILRNQFLGIRYVESFTGRRPRTIHLGDLPGLPAQFPQMMAGCGLESVVLSRGGPAATPLFRWAGPDGTRVTAWYSPKCYVWGGRLARPPEEFESRHAADLRTSAREIAGRTPAHVFMHCGEDLSVPTDAIAENVRRWNAASRELPMRLATPEEYFKAVRGAKGVPVLRGELPTVWGNWPDAAYLDVTNHHSAAEAALLWAERLAALDIAEAGPAAWSPTDAAGLQSAWKALLESLDHNYSHIATEETHEEKNRLTRSAQIAAEAVIRLAMARRAGAVRRAEEAVPVLVFNPSSYERGECVSMRAILYGDVSPGVEERWAYVYLGDNAGNPVPMQEVKRRRCGPDEILLAFQARAVPALGYRTYYLKPGKAAPRPAEAGGRLQWRFDKRRRAFSLEQDGEAILPSLTIRGIEQRETNQVMQLASTGRVFPFVVERVVAGNDPVVRSLAVHGRVADTPVRLIATTAADDDRAELQVRLEHPGRGFLRLQLHGELPGGRRATGYVGGPFVANPVSNVLPGCGPTLGDEVLPDEWPRIREAQDWFLVQGRRARRALAVATPRKLVELLPEGFGINLLSSMSAKWIRSETVFHPFAGVYEMRFLFAPVTAGDIVSAGRLGESNFMPLRTFCDYSGPADRRAPPIASCLIVTNPAVRLTALKPAADGEGLIARLLEGSGRRVTTAVEWAFPVRRARECNMLEEPVRRADLRRLAFRPFEIKTIRLDVRRKNAGR